MELPSKNEVVYPLDLQALLIAKGRKDVWIRIVNKPPAKPFKSDGASCFPDKIGGVNLYPAAFFHDIEYWVGGTAEQRVVADARLIIDAVNDCGANAELARTLFAGVSIGGGPNTHLPWRWGFGQE